LKLLVAEALRLLDRRALLGVGGDQGWLWLQAVQLASDLARPLHLASVDLDRRHGVAWKAEAAQHTLGDHWHQIGALVGDALGLEHKPRRHRRMGTGNDVEPRLHGEPS